MTKEERKEYNRLHYQANKGKVKAQQKELYAGGDPDKIEKRKQTRFKYHVKSSYGVTLDEYDAVMSVGKCEVCGKEDDLVYHHHHGTMKAACLCRLCNLGIGGLKDDPELLLKAYELQRRLGNV